MKNALNKYWIIGKHAVNAAITNPDRKKYRLCITKDIKLRNDIKDLVPEILTKDQISNIISTNAAHQGIALQVENLKSININDFIIKNKNNRKNIIIILDQITDTQNIGAIIRSAQAFSINAILCQEKNSPKENTHISKAAAGAIEHVPLIYVKNISQTLKLLKENNYWSIGLSGKAEVSLLEVCRNKNFINGNIVLVAGSEGKGIRDLVKKNCDICCKIDIEKSINSLNVSVALAIAMYEITRSQKI